MVAVVFIIVIIIVAVVVVFVIVDVVVFAVAVVVPRVGPLLQSSGERALAPAWPRHRPACLAAGPSIRPPNRLLAIRLIGSCPRPISFWRPNSICSILNHEAGRQQMSRTPPTSACTLAAGRRQSKWPSVCVCLLGGGLCARGSPPPIGSEWVRKSIIDGGRRRRTRTRAPLHSRAPGAGDACPLDRCRPVFWRRSAGALLRQEKWHLT
jgi:hypothetical protein